MSLELADAHLRRALAFSSEFERFKMAWLAFVQLYQLERGFGLAARDADLIWRAGDRLQDRVDRVVNRVILHPLVSIQPSIFDEKIREESGVKDCSRHNVLKKRVQQLASRVPDLDDLRALIDVLYMIRCNLYKGYKLHDSSRDQEVLAAGAPVLLQIVQELRSAHEIAVERPA